MAWMERERSGKNTRLKLKKLQHFSLKAQWEGCNEANVYTYLKMKEDFAG